MLFLLLGARLTTGACCSHTFLVWSQYFHIPYGRGTCDERLGVSGPLFAVCRCHNFLARLRASPFAYYYGTCSCHAATLRVCACAPAHTSAAVTFACCPALPASACRCRDGALPCLLPSYRYTAPFHHRVQTYASYALHVAAPA